MFGRLIWFRQGVKIRKNRAGVELKKKRAIRKVKGLLSNPRLFEVV